MKNGTGTFSYEVFDVQNKRLCQKKIAILHFKNYLFQVSRNSSKANLKIVQKLHRRMKMLEVTNSTKLCIAQKKRRYLLDIWESYGTVKY